MEVAEGLDEGGVYARSEIEIGQDETAAELRSRLAVVGAELLVERLRAGLGTAVPQSGDVTYAAKIDRSESRLDFTRSAVELHRTVRVGRAWAQFRGKRLGIEATSLCAAVPEQPGVLVTGTTGAGPGPIVATADGGLQLVTVKPEGKRAMSAADWANGVQPQAGDRLE